MVRAEIQPLPWIAGFVVALHAIFVIWLSFLSTFAPIPATKARVVVHTIKLNPHARAPSKKFESLSYGEIPAPAPYEMPPPVEIEQMPRLEDKIKEKKVIEEKPKIEKRIEPKKEQKKVSPEKVTPKKKAVEKPAPKKQAPKQIKKTAALPTQVIDTKLAEKKKKQQELLAKAQESIANIRPTGVKIDASQKGKGSELKIPQLTLAAIAEEPNSETGWSAGEVSYRDELAGRLKLLLKLPEFGSVQLKMTLQRTGKVMKVTIIKAASQINRSYVEKLLPTLQFPSFGTHFGQESEHTFTITLNNDF